MDGVLNDAVNVQILEHYASPFEMVALLVEVLVNYATEKAQEEALMRGKNEMGGGGGGERDGSRDGGEGGGRERDGDTYAEYLKESTNGMRLGFESCEKEKKVSGGKLVMIWESDNHDYETIVGMSKNFTKSLLITKEKKINAESE